MPQGTIIIDTERCKGCELCTSVCPQNVLFMDESAINAKGYHPAILAEDDKNSCTGCALCAVICPDVCITVYREAKPTRKPKTGPTNLQVDLAPRSLKVKVEQPRAIMQMEIES